ncbi:MAG: Glycogen synthase [Chlamydiia bacterium]|nr:Glycogen synthase [Chlamydiia bacterium]MCH9615124.1 Glycogen synthase [Chlamydiia bacterium]MCH9628554.1 Glycogen synthase [Chlamydiia bacterium]
MRITHVSSEIAPLAKAGGLGDVLYGLSKALIKSGEEVEIILPKYSHVDFGPLGTLPPITVLEDGKHYTCAMHKADLDGIPLILIEHPYFERGTIYGEADDNDRFLFFSLAAMIYLQDRIQPPPHILHLHDWPTSAASLLYTHTFALKHLRIPKVILTIHNIEHQGRCNLDNLEKIGIPDLHNNLLDPRDPRLINLLKGGIETSTVFTTVSPSYAAEIRTPDFGFGLENIIEANAGKLHGILNGIDMDYWNPKTDPHIKHHYDAYSLDQKKHNREAFPLPTSDRPLIAIISRLAPQKGPEYILEAIDFFLERGCAIALLGEPTPETRHSFETLPKHPHLFTHFTFDNALAHQTFAAADYILIPSNFEPCGLTQMIGMRYGAIPIARATGGLKDTIKHTVNGYLFHDHEDFLQTLEHALTLPTQEMIKTAMLEDHSWKTSAQKYLELYSE